MSSMKRAVPSGGTAVVALLSALVLNRGRVTSWDRLKRLSILGRILFAFLVLNWRSFPLWWHAQIFSIIPVIRWRIFRKGVENSFSIAENPFERKIVTKSFCSFDLSDWNGHMSNSSYSKTLDVARLKWLIDVTGPPMASEFERMWSPLAATSFVFMKEIPMLARFEIEVHVASWDDKWIYYIARFTTAGKTASSLRTLHCLALSRSCYKLHGSRLSIPPGRILSCSGVGPSKSNWERTLRLRKEKKSREWLFFGGREVARKRAQIKGGGEVEGVKADEAIGGEEGWESDGMECYEEERKRRLEIVARFGDVNSEDWKEL